MYKKKESIKKERMNLAYSVLSRPLLPDGSKIELFLQPLCSATSNLTLMDIVIGFDTEKQD